MWRNAALKQPLREPEAAREDDTERRRRDQALSDRRISVIEKGPGRRDGEDDADLFGLDTDVAREEGPAEGGTRHFHLPQHIHETEAVDEPEAKGEEQPSVVFSATLQQSVRAHEDMLSANDRLDEATPCRSREVPAQRRYDDRRQRRDRRFLSGAADGDAIFLARMARTVRR